jgi:hypothetical protein
MTSKIWENWQFENQKWNYTGSVTIIDHSPTWKANSQSSNQETPHLLWISQTDYHVCKRSYIPYPRPNDSSILSHFISFTFHHNIIILLSMPMPPNWSIPFRCSGHNSVGISAYLMHIIWSTYPPLPNLITLINLPIQEKMHKNLIWGNVIHVYQKKKYLRAALTNFI